MKQDDKLRKFLASRVYNTSKWLKTIKMIRTDRGMICDHCGKLITGKSNVHHKIHLNYSNYHDEDIVYNQKNLMLLHIQCHNELHNRYKPAPTFVKTAYNEVIIDYDKREELL